MKVWVETTDCRVSRDPALAGTAILILGIPKKKEVENQVKVIMAVITSRYIHF